MSSFPSHPIHTLGRARGCYIPICRIMKAPVKSIAKGVVGDPTLEPGFPISLRLTGFWIDGGQVMALYFTVKVGELP